MPKPIYRLDSRQPSLFPPAHLVAKHSPAAFGGDLSPERLLAAYEQGFFPWYDEPPILWWNPDPRFVLYPSEIKVSKSMRPYFNQQKYTVRYDQAFPTVIRYCRDTPRHGQAGTWINDDIVAAYEALHTRGFAHSVEVYDQSEQLVGGLYGIAIGRIFFGESMFAHARDASKFGMISLAKRLTQRNYRLIDCQQATTHLASLGARSISRRDFVAILALIGEEETERGAWENEAS